MFAIPLNSPTHAPPSPQKKSLSFPTARHRITVVGPSTVPGAAAPVSPSTGPVAPAAELSAARAAAAATSAAAWCLGVCLVIFEVDQLTKNHQWVPLDPQKHGISIFKYDSFGNFVWLICLGGY